MILHSITAYTPDPDCTRCAGIGLVCEEHPELPWDTGTHDCGGAGMVCACVTWPCGAVGEHPDVCPKRETKAITIDGSGYRVPR